ncbi:MAG: ABC transporter permease, partial [Gammaproteobacteria bacterium]
SALCALVLLAAFVVPLAHLLHWAWVQAEPFGRGELQLGLRSVTLGALAAALTAAAALVLAYAVRQRPGALTQTSTRIATLGYAFPGTLLAVGLYVPIAQALGALESRLGFGGAAQGGLLLLLMAYGVRFMAVAHAPIGAALLRIKPSLDEAARLQGAGGTRLALRVHLPLIRSGVLTAALLVLVDVMKEMPITLMTRPFGWDTLATRVFELTSEGEWARAAAPALAIVAVGLLPVLWLDRGLDRGLHAGGAARGSAA